MKSKHLLLIIGLLNALAAFHVNNLIGLHWNYTFGMILCWITWIGITLVFVNSK